MTELPWTLTLWIPGPWWMSSNMRLHWAAKAKRTAWVRKYAALEATKQGLVRGLDTAHVMAFIGYPTGAKADPQNAAPTVKAAIDGGIVDYGCLPDDDHTHLIGPDYRRDGLAPKGTHTIRLVITPNP